MNYPKYIAAISLILFICIVSSSGRQTGESFRSGEQIQLGLGIAMETPADGRRFSTLSNPRIGERTSSVIELERKGPVERIVIYASAVKSPSVFPSEWRETGQRISFLESNCPVRWINGMENGHSKSKFIASTTSMSEYITVLIVVDHENLQLLPRHCIDIISTIQRL